MVNPSIKVKTRKNVKKDATEIQMMVESRTEESYCEFDKRYIISSLEKELHLSADEGLKVANKVEEKLMKSGLGKVTSSFVREMVNSILLEDGHQREMKQHSNLSIPLYDVKKIIEDRNTENSNLTLSPESINLTLAGQILKQYALKEVFPPEVSEAHLKGDIHLHDLDFINRPYCSGNSVEYVKKYGLRLPGIKTQSKPAQHALTLVNHLSCFANYLQGLFAGAIGFDAVNMFFAPYTESLDDDGLIQCAQHLLYSFAQLAGGRGGQTAFVDFNVYLNVPEHFKNTPVVAPGGKYNGKTYSDYENETRRFLNAIFDVLFEGDANHANIAFPKILMHVNNQTFAGDDPLYMKACKLNSKRGSVYILYDRGESIKIAQCCRLQIGLTKEEAERMMAAPEEMRFSAWQNITLNLPRIAYKNKDMEGVYKEIDRLVEVTMKGHIAKKEYIEKILDMGTKGCLSFLTRGMDGKPYLRREEAKFLVGMIGLNEMVQCLSGSQLHENDDALFMGLKIIAYLHNSVNRLSKKYGVTCMLEQTPAEGLGLRAALLDIRYFPESLKYIRGNIKTGDVYYTNSVHFAYDSGVDIFTRIEKQSKFDPMIQAGTIIHNWFGESEPDYRALASLYKNVFQHTAAVQTADSPDMTVCCDCGTMHRGFHDSCPKCASKNIYCETRVTGYFSQTSGWTKGKLAELKDRTKVNLEMRRYIMSGFNATEEKVYFFGKQNCPKCDELKKHIQQSENKDRITMVDTKDHEGLALACYYNVNELPVMLKARGGEIISKTELKGSFLKWMKQNV